MYRILAKILVVRIKRIFSRVISKDQFGFLVGREIHDEKGVFQKCIHTMEPKIPLAIVMKKDLS
jgi:hypothetical protein